MLGFEVIQPTAEFPQGAGLDGSWTDRRQRYRICFNALKKAFDFLNCFRDVKNIFTNMRKKNASKRNCLP